MWSQSIEILNPCEATIEMLEKKEARHE